jgi:hypothetical protein
VDLITKKIAFDLFRVGKSAFNQGFNFFNSFFGAKYWSRYLPRRGYQIVYQTLFNYLCICRPLNTRCTLKRKHKTPVHEPIQKFHTFQFTKFLAVLSKNITIFLLLKGTLFIIGGSACDILPCRSQSTVRASQKTLLLIFFGVTVNLIHIQLWRPEDGCDGKD